MVWGCYNEKKKRKEEGSVYFFPLPSPPQTHVWRYETSVSSVVLFGRGAVSLGCKEDVLRHEKWAGDKNPTGKFSSCASVEQQERKKKREREREWKNPLERLPGSRWQAAVAKTGAAEALCVTGGVRHANETQPAVRRRSQCGSCLPAFPDSELKLLARRVLHSSWRHKQTARPLILHHVVGFFFFF